MQQLDEHRVDHLFVLVGNNPLPCLVAGRLLLAVGGTIHLVYSEETERYASGLADVLQTDLLRDGVALNGWARDATKVFSLVTAKLRRITSGSVGLHYTGGTKVMSVHAHHAVLSQVPSATCSYLDSDRLAIYCERGGVSHGAPIRLLDPALQAIIGLTLQDLWRIHRVTPLPHTHRKYTQRCTPFFTGVPQRLAEHFALGERQLWLDRLQGSKDHTVLPIQKNDPISSLPFDVGREINNEQSQITTYGELCGYLGKGARNWLDSTWLEDLVLAHLRELRGELALGQVVRSASTARPSDGEPWFELDVVALRGYQLFVFSCYIGDDADTCKSKLFEAAHRAHQLGGGEARFALVCGHLDRKQVKQQLDGLLPQDAFEVFGLSEWPNLRDKLREWILRVDREHR